MARIVIVHHRWDSDIADLLAGHLHRCGHKPVLLLTGGPQRLARLDKNARMVVIWSGSLALEVVGLQQATLWAAFRRTVLVRIDDTEPPTSIGDAQQIVLAPASAAAEMHEAVVGALKLHGHSPTIRWRPRLPAILRKPVHAALATGAAAVLLVTTAGLGVSFWGSQHPAAPEATLTETSDLKPRFAPAQEARPHVAALLESDDPIALRAALLVLGTAPEAEPLRARLLLLEDQAWREVLETHDAADRLFAIEAFRSLFPGSPRLTGAVETAVREARDQIVLTQRGLVALGFEPGPANGVMTPHTRAAVQAFQTSRGLAATGAIDAPLQHALRAALPAGWDARPARPSPFDADQGRSDAAESGGAASRPPSPSAALSLLQDCPRCPSLVVLPQGRGQIGDTGSDGNPSERPARIVVVDYGLAIGQYEVTVGEWAACVEDNGCPPPGPPSPAASPRAPVVGVSFEDARLYVAWLQRRTGHGYRLPSEAEWEYAARAGAITALASDPAQGLCTMGNVADASSAFPERDETCRDGFPASRAPAGQFRPNAFGLYDIVGNVWEWTQDCWHASYRGAPLTPAPWLRGCDTRDRVLRGGSFMTGPRHNRLSTRLPVQSDLRLGDVGFRVVRPVGD